MRALLVLTPIAIIGAFAVHQAVTSQEICTETDRKVEKAEVSNRITVPAVPAISAVPAVPAVPSVPAVPTVPAVPDAEALRTAVAAHAGDIEIHIPAEAIERAMRLAEQFEMDAGTEAEFEAAVREAMLALEENMAEFEFDMEEAYGEMGLSREFFRDLARSIESSVSVATDEGREVTVRVPQRRRN